MQEFPGIEHVQFPPHSLSLPPGQVCDVHESFAETVNVSTKDIPRQRSMAAIMALTTG